MARDISFDIFARDRASQTFDHVAKSSDGLGAKLGKFGKGAAMALGGFGLAAATAAGGFAAMGVKTAAANEQAQISFSTMLGSGKKAQDFLKQLQAFAAATPFEFPELQTAASSLISAGINANKVIPIMRTLGDVTSGMGTGSEGVQRATVALQQMNAAGKITAEDLNQLRDAGIPVYDLLAKALHKPKSEVAQLAQNGKLGKDALDKMMKALETGKGLERFSGLMDKQSKSLTGLWSTFKDTLGQGLAKALAPAIPLLKDGLAKGSDLLAKAMPKIAEGLKNAIPKIVTFAKHVASVAGWVKNDLWPALQRGYQAVMPSLKTAFHAVSQFVTGTLVPAIQKFGNWIKTDLWPAIERGYHTIMPALKQAFQIVAGAFKSTGKDGEGFGGVVKKIGEFITKVAIPAISTIAKVALPILASGLRINIEAVKILWRVFETLSGIVGKVIAFILRKFADLSSMWAGVLRALAKVPGFGWAKAAADKLDRAAGKASALASSIERIPNRKNIDVVVSVHQQQIRIPTAGNAHGNIPKNATGTRNFRGGLSWVGERGPELVYLPKGSDVYSNGESMAMARGGVSRGPSGGGGDQNITVQLVLDGRVVQQSLLKLKRQGGVNLGLA